MERILLVEDDKAISQPLAEYLNREGYQVDTAAGQTDGLRLFGQNSYDLVLLDISLQDGNGFSACLAMKQQKDTPVIFLTASGEEHSVVAGLEMGADDYVAKPFRPRELLSRIRAVTRRNRKKKQELYLGNLYVDMDRGMVSKNGKDLCLSALEYRLFLILLNNRNKVLSRNRLLEEIWDAAGEYVNDNTLTVYIKRLREKVEDDPQNPVVIRTVRGFGYMIGDEGRNLF
ncbi:MAG: response regulator transcription factor [Lachnospiraceae bacterium]|nr:response regulator transcription factor [Lachnospiraceae bacterium]